MFAVEGFVGAIWEFNKVLSVCEDYTAASMAASHGLPTDLDVDHLIWARRRDGDSEDAQPIVDARLVVVAHVWFDPGHIRCLGSRGLFGLVHAVLHVVVHAPSLAMRVEDARGLGRRVAVVVGRIVAVAYCASRVGDGLAPPIVVETVALEIPVPLDRIAGEHFKVAVHDRTQSPDHDGGHGIA